MQFDCQTDAECQIANGGNTCFYCDLDTRTCLFRSSIVAGEVVDPDTDTIERCTVGFDALAVPGICAANGGSCVVRLWEPPEVAGAGRSPGAPAVCLH